MILLFVKHAILGFLLVLDKQLLNYFPPLTFLALRTLISGIIFLIWFGIFDYKKTIITTKNLLSLGVLAFLYIYLTNFLLFKGLQILYPAKASLIYNCNPFIVALLSALLFKERLSVIKVAGVVIGWLGFVPILFFDNPWYEGTTSLISRGELFVIAAACAVALSYIVLQKIMHTDEPSTTLTSAVSLTVGGIFAGTHAYFSEIRNGLYPIMAPGVMKYFIIIMITTLFWSYLNSYLAQKYSASMMSLTGLTAPLFAALFEWMLFGTGVSWSFYVSLAFVVTGLSLFSYGDLKASKAS